MYAPTRSAALGPFGIVLTGLALAALLLLLPGCPPRNSSWEPSFPETAASGIGPASP